MRAEGFLWSVVTISHRSIGMLSHSVRAVGQERWPAAHAITTQSWPFLITSQRHRQTVWQRVFSFFSKLRNKSVAEPRLPGWIKTWPVMLKINRKQFFSISKKKFKNKKHALEATGHQQKSKTNWEPAWAEPRRRNTGASLLLYTAASKEGEKHSYYTPRCKRLFSKKTSRNRHQRKCFAFPFNKDDRMTHWKRG